MEEIVLPLAKNNPQLIRLDGQTTGGNRNHFAWFRYKGNTWKMHSDTHIGELIKAFKEMESVNDQFITGETNKSGNSCLVLKPDLADRPKHIYIYMVK